MIHPTAILMVITELTAILLLTVALPVTLVCAIPTMVIWTHHKRKMEELRIKEQAKVSAVVTEEIAAMRKEIQALRDTTMQYDLSFDTALQRLEQRVQNVERRPITPAPTTAPAPQQSVGLSN